MLNINKTVFIQRQARLSQDFSQGNRAETFKRLFTTPPPPESKFLETKTGRLEQRSPFAPTIFVGTEIDGLTNRSFGGSTSNKSETGDISTNATMTITRDLLMKYKDTVFKDVLEKGMSNIEGNHFTLDKLDLTGLTDQDFNLLYDHMIISMADIKEGKEQLHIVHMGEKAAALTQDYLRGELTKRDLNPATREDYKRELSNVWKYLKENGRTNESKENTIALTPQVSSNGELKA